MLSSRRALILAVMTVGVLLVISGMAVFGQEGDEHPIVTSATDAVGVGSYVAAEAFGVPAGEDPATQPAQAIVLPYGLYPAMNLTSVEDFTQPENAAEGFTFSWELIPAEGSSATLLHDGTVAIFQTDVEGTYELVLTATDPNGNEAETSWLVYATTYVGVGGQGGLPVEEDFNCASCHEDTVEGWAATAHATIFTRIVDGTNPWGSAESLPHITTGFDTSELAANNGFDDRAAEEGWTFPETREMGNWEAMVSEHPNTAGLANIQCEACHGAGYLHVTEGSRRDSMIGLGLAAGTCAQCHAAEGPEPIPQQWEMSAHALRNAEAFTYPIGEERLACVRCHSGAGYVDWANGVPEEELRSNYQTITCAVCHDPHNVTNPNQLRVFDTVTLPNGLEITDANAAATCMSCHNARRDPVASVEGERFGTPHYSTAGELMYGVGGYTWGLDLPSSGHGGAIENTCVACHMSSPEGGERGTVHSVGGHTFAMVDAEGVENIAACQTCHEGQTSFEFEAFRDYDGDGTIESNEVEIEGLREMIAETLVANGVNILDHHPYYEMPEGASIELKAGAWNLSFTGSGGTAVHNLKYAVSLLQLTYERLTGEPVPNAYIIQPLAAAE